MSEAPERIWIDKTYGRHPEDWDFTDGRYLTKAQLRKKVEYIRADLVEELEAKLAKAVEALKHAKLNMPHPDQLIDDTLIELTGGKDA